ncbi:hypothetical protein DOLIC_00054 [Dolichomitus sp. PSUC_FEM 10030005]|nr:hypothetical protein [Dolichomitus sp. PSUC_FEM 10030005]
MDTIDWHKDPRKLTRSELQNIPKQMLLKHFGSFISYLWDKLPDHIKSDNDVLLYLPCYTHYRTSNLRDYIDGSEPPQRRKCTVCANS